MSFTIVFGAVLLASCAKVDAVEQDENGNIPILIDEPVALPPIEPIVVNDDATQNNVPNEATNQVESGEQSR